MKKLIYILAIAVASFSCSKDDAPSTNTNIDNILVKKITETDASGNSTTYVHNYNGNKIVSIVNQDDSGDKEVFTYTDNLVTKIETYTEGEIVETSVYAYKDGKIDHIEITYLDEEHYEFKKAKKLSANKRSFKKTSGSEFSEIKERQEFTYNSNGTITIEDYDYDLTEEKFIRRPTTTTVKLLNGMQSEITISSQFEELEYKFEAKLIFKYDDKNNYYKNIVGLNNFMNLSYGVNNITSISISSITEIEGLTEYEKMFFDMFAGTLQAEGTFDYTYNSNKFPTEIKAKLKSGSELIASTIKIQY